MLAGGLGIMSGALLGLGRCLGVFFVLNKFDVCNLRTRRRRNQEEESKDETGGQNRYMEDVRAGSGFRHLQGVITVETLALDTHRMVVGIAGAIDGITEEKHHNKKGSRGAEMQLPEGAVQLFVQFHVVGLTEGSQPLENRGGEHEEDKNEVVEDADYEEEQPFTLLTIVNLPQTGQYKRKTASHIGVTLGSLSTGISGIGTHESIPITYLWPLRLLANPELTLKRPRFTRRISNGLRTSNFESLS